MTDMLRYKNYFGTVEYNAEDEVFFGRIAHIRDLVSYEGEDARSLKAAFEEGVNDYLALCEEESRAPDQPFKGSFNVRPGSDLHRKAALFAKEHAMNLNQVVSNALEHYLAKPRQA